MESLENLRLKSSRLELENLNLSPGFFETFSLKLRGGRAEVGESLVSRTKFGEGKARGGILCFSSNLLPGRKIHLDSKGLVILWISPMAED